MTWPSAADEALKGQVIAGFGGLAQHSWCLTVSRCRPPPRRRLGPARTSRRSIAELPNSWLVNGAGLKATATDGTPEPILEVLALTAVPDGVLSRETTSDTAASPPPAPDMP